MRAIAFMLAAVVATTSISHAQPGAPADPVPPDPSPYPPAPYPDPLPPQPMPVQPPPPYSYQPVAVQVTPDEHALLQRGEITDIAHVGGGMANVFLGFGIGQAIQGRWSEKGWLFTLGSAASIAAIVVGVTQSFEEGGDDVPALFIAGYLSFLVFHVWGAVDAFVEPPKHNRRVRELKMRLGMPTYFGQRVVPYLMKSRDGGGGTAGLVLRF